MYVQSKWLKTRIIHYGNIKKEMYLTFLSILKWLRSGCSKRKTVSSKSDSQVLMDKINKVRFCSNKLEEDLQIATQMEMRANINIQRKVQNKDGMLKKKPTKTI